VHNEFSTKACCNHWPAPTAAHPGGRPLMHVLMCQSLRDTSWPAPTAAPPGCHHMLQLRTSGSLRDTRWSTPTAAPPGGLALLPMCTCKRSQGHPLPCAHCRTCRWPPAAAPIVPVAPVGPRPLQHPQEAARCCRLRGFPRLQGFPRQTRSLRVPQTRERNGKGVLLLPLPPRQEALAALPGGFEALSEAVAHLRGLGP
jgi:hypothetical protein